MSNIERPRPFLKQTDYIQSRYSGTQSRLIKLVYLCSVAWVACFCFVQITCCVVSLFVWHFVYAARPSALHLPVVSGTPALLTQKIHQRHGYGLQPETLFQPFSGTCTWITRGGWTRSICIYIYNIPIYSSCHVSSSCIDVNSQIESNPDHTHIQCRPRMVPVAPTFTGNWILQTLPTMTQAPRSK